MARIGVLPLKTAVELREPGFDATRIPAATAASAGVMTAEHVKMLEEVWQHVRGGSDLTASPVIIERAADTSHLMTKAEARALLSAVPRSMDMAPALQALRSEIAALQRDMTDNAQRLLEAPSSGEVVDPVARQVLDGVIAGFESLDTRLREVEGVVHAIRSLAEIKGAEEAA